MSVTNGPDLEREEQRERFDKIIDILELMDEKKINERQNSGLSDRELAEILLELAVEKERPTEFSGEPLPANVQRDFFSRKASPT